MVVVDRLRRLTIVRLLESKGRRMIMRMKQRSSYSTIVLAVVVVTMEGMILVCR